MARVLPRSSRPMASKMRASAGAPSACTLPAKRVDPISTIANSRCSRVDRSTSRRSWSSKCGRVYRPVALSRRPWSASSRRSFSLARCCCSSCSSAARNCASFCRCGPGRSRRCKPAPAPAVRRRRQAQHGEVVPRAGPLETVLAGQRLGLAPAPSVRRRARPWPAPARPVRRRCGPGCPTPAGPGSAAMRLVDVLVASGGGVLDRQASRLVAQPGLEHAGQHRAEAGATAASAWRTRSAWTGWTWVGGSKLQGCSLQTSLERIVMLVRAAAQIKQR